MRHRLKRLFAETVYRMRAVAATPGRQATAIAVGFFIGCSPLFGLHLAMCLLAARLFRLSPVTMYASAQVSYPVFAPFLYYAELQVGALARRGAWLDLELATLRAMDNRELTRFLFGAAGDLFAGSLLVGAAGALLFGSVSYEWLRRRKTDYEGPRIASDVSRRYIESSIFDFEYSRGKIKGDPVYFLVLRERLLPEHGVLVDLGCGRGLMLALLEEARSLHRDGGWPAEWPPPPAGLELVGVELRHKAAKVAREALGRAATIVEADLETYTPPPCDAVLLFDVLHYMPADAQEALVSRIAAALRPGGVLLVREAHTQPRWRYLVTSTGERLASLLRGTLRPRFCFRPAGEWVALLERHGFSVEIKGGALGTPYSNVLLVARRAVS